MTEREFMIDQVAKSPVKIVAGSIEAINKFLNESDIPRAIERYSTTGRIVPQYIPFHISTELNHDEVKIE